MLYRKKVYEIFPTKLSVFNDFFHEFLYPNQIKNGAKLVGRWVNENQTEITAIWEYESLQQYKSIEQKIKNSELHKLAQRQKEKLGRFFIHSHQEFLNSTGTYHSPKHIVSVSGYITNEKGEVLLVRNNHRSDTYEMTGGQVEEGEQLQEAIHREIKEETGIEVKLQGITGIYQNITKGIICIVFRGEYVSGTPRTAEGETMEVLFTKVGVENVDKWIKRPHFQTRLLDAIDPTYLPFEAFYLRPYELIKRYEGSIAMKKGE
jgi:8-oxo-dGTP diphosphatase